MEDGIMNTDQENNRNKINRETARIAWKELQRHFASGATLVVSDDLDLVEVALQMSSDNRALFEQWLTVGKINEVSDEQALAWYEADAKMWSVVVSPWVLVQQISDLGNGAL